MLEGIATSTRDHFDLTDPGHQKNLYQVVDDIFKLKDMNPDEVDEYCRRNSPPLEFRLAAKLYRSRCWVNSNTTTCKIAIVFAMWGEQNRLHPKTLENPNGEDTLRTKLQQLEWLFKNSEIDWHLYAVDDGCPYGSGKIAQSITRDHELKDRVSVMFLADHLPAKDGPLKSLASPDDSRKGGAIILGSHQAIMDGGESVSYTDADNSVHLGQSGLLMEPFIDRKIRVVLGDRKDPDAVLVKQEDRWGIGIKLLRHMQRMLAHEIFSRGIMDTQAAFKLFESGLLSKIIDNPTVFDFSFDSDWIAGAIAKNETFEKVPFAFIDSFEESASITQGPMTTWETLLLGLVKSVRRRDLQHNENMARVLETQIRSSKDLDLLIDHLPPQLENVNDKDLGNPAVMDPQEIERWILVRKQEA
jgi:hypothetical protein